MRTELRFCLKQLAELGFSPIQFHVALRGSDGEGEMLCNEIFEVAVGQLLFDFAQGLPRLNTFLDDSQRGFLSFVMRPLSEGRQLFKRWRWWGHDGEIATRQ